MNTGVSSFGVLSIFSRLFPSVPHLPCFLCTKAKQVYNDMFASKKSTNMREWLGSGPGLPTMKCVCEERSGKVYKSGELYKMVRALDGLGTEPVGRGGRVKSDTARDLEGGNVMLLNECVNLLAG